MKLASWVYWPMEDMKKPARRRAAIDLVQKTGIDIALGVWSVDEMVANAPVLEKLGDELAARGIELHLGITPFSAPRGVPRQRLYQYQVDGKRRCENLCPSWPENRDLVIRRVERLCKQVRFIGLHLDFIRYLFSPGVPWQLEWEAGREWIDTFRWCECASCQAARTRWLGRGEVTGYDRLHPGVIFKELEFRKRNVEEVLHRIRAATNQHGRVLSIAQRVQYLNRAILEGQDWMEWAEQGLFEFTCPMNYSTCTETFRERLAQNLPRLSRRGSVKVYEGVSRKSSAGESSIDTVLEQMDIALELGADGVTLFHLGVLQSGEHQKIATWKARRSG